MRVLILGMNNPHYDGTAAALSPMHGAGKRLFEMSRMSLDAYEQRFDRANLVQGKRWDMRKARRSFAALSLEGYRAVICLGRDVACVAGLGGEAVFSPSFCKGLPACWVWHPSGMCRAYNDPRERERLGEVLRFWPESREEVHLGKTA